MIDTFIFDSLLKGIESNIQLILVGDTFQLPSVGAGLILNDLVNSKLFSYTSLERIYRQSDNSYIAYLAREIKDHNLSENFTEKRDDYNFIETDSKNVTKMIKEICEKSIKKGLKVDELQILAPMYKGENGIDHLNLVLQNLFNPPKKHLNELRYGDITYRENDKILQLVNNPDCNVYNGDIGYIDSIDTIYEPRKKDVIRINFDGNYVEYNKEDLHMIKHAYAITIHKSQGSEFPHVIMPISKNYYKMLYNKLIYTGVSRAKKSLVIVGEKNSFLMAMNNDYSSNRKTTLKEVLLHNI
jgi:exodeoxyribonuclease V alpha subunit